jgi:hypothetical protein
MADDAYSALTRCKMLRGLRLSFLRDPAVLLVIGRNLFRLNLMRPSNEVVDGIVAYCPNLQYLEIEIYCLDEKASDLLMGSFKDGLKKMAKLRLNKKTIRLGTDWEGYQ